MFVRNRTDAPWRERGGLVFCILLQEGTCRGSGLRRRGSRLRPVRASVCTTTFRSRCIRSYRDGDDAGRR